MEESLDVRMVQSVAPATPSTAYNSKVPKKGEIIFNDGLNNFKVGNGSTSYGNLNDFLGKTITNVSTDTTSTPYKTTITFSDGSSVVISDGNDGTSVSIKESEAACQEIGDGYIASNGHLMVLTTIDPRTFNDAGEIKGPRGATWFNGTAVTSATSDIPAGSSIAVGDYYLNTNTYIVWKCLSLSDTTKWQNLGCIKGTSAYLFIRFANSNQPQSADMHTSWQSGDTYIGFQVTTSPTASTDYTDYTWAEFTGTDTKNTAGATNNQGDKLFIVGTAEQSANPQSYTNQKVYIQDNELYSNNSKVALNDDLTTLTDLVYSLHYQPSWVVSPTLVFAGGTATTVTATAKLLFNGTAESEFTASTPSGWTAGTTSGTTRTFTNTLNATATATTTITKDNYSKTKSATVTAVYPIYYGQSSNGSLQVLTNLTQFDTATNTAINWAYTVNMTASNYFIVAVPSSGVTKPSQVGVGGASGFFENLETIGTYTVTEPRSSASVLYTFYRTQATQTAGSKDYYLK